jgi:hypothetical protein
MGLAIATTREERRTYRRLDIRLPLQYCPKNDSGTNICRTVTRNISTGGMYFETDDLELKAGMTLDLELTVPPGEGYSPYQGHIMSVGEIIRVDDLGPAANATTRRIGVATRFRDALRLSF